MITYIFLQTMNNTAVATNVPQHFVSQLIQYYGLDGYVIIIHHETYLVVIYSLLGLLPIFGCWWPTPKELNKVIVWSAIISK